MEESSKYSLQKDPLVTAGKVLVWPAAKKSASKAKPLQFQTNNLHKYYETKPSLATERKIDRLMEMTEENNKLLKMLLGLQSPPEYNLSQPVSPEMLLSTDEFIQQMDNGTPLTIDTELPFEIGETMYELEQNFIANNKD